MFGSLHSTRNRSRLFCPLRSTDCSKHATFDLLYITLLHIDQYEQDRKISRRFKESFASVSMLKDVKTRLRIKQEADEIALLAVGEQDGDDIVNCGARSPEEADMDLRGYINGGITAELSDRARWAFHKCSVSAGDMVGMKVKSGTGSRLYGIAPCDRTG